MRSESAYFFWWKNHMQQAFPSLVRYAYLNTFSASGSRVKIDSFLKFFFEIIISAFFEPRFGIFPRFKSLKLGITFAFYRFLAFFPAFGYAFYIFFRHEICVVFFFHSTSKMIIDIIDDYRI